MYSNYLKNKRVCLVGPSPHLIGENKGKLIDEYDVIVRLNRSYPIPDYRKKDIGSRTDILYNCLNTDIENGGKLDLNAIKRDVIYISMPYPNIPPFSSDISEFIYDNHFHEIPLHIIDTKLYNITSNIMGTRPNTGVLSIIDILSFNVKELYVTGITFFKGGYDPAYRDTIDGIKVIDQKHSEELVLNRMGNYNNHSQEPQINYIKKLYHSDDRFKGDDMFNNIMNK